MYDGQWLLARAERFFTVEFLEIKDKNPHHAGVPNCQLLGLLCSMVGQFYCYFVIGWIKNPERNGLRRYLALEGIVAVIFASKGPESIFLDLYSTSNLKPRRLQL
jgi:hypothetical protein